MTSEVPEQRRGEPIESYVVCEDGQPDLFIDIYEHPEFSEAFDSEVDEVLAEADSAGGTS